VKALILLAILAVMLPIAAGGEDMLPIYTWDRGLDPTKVTDYQYFGFCSDRDSSRMRKPESLGSAPFTVIPDPSIKKPFIVKTPFVTPNEKEGDIWKGLANFVKQIQHKQ
jgi:hypothetical protein